MAFNVHIKIDDIKGESADEKHVGEIDVYSWSWGATQSGTTHVGTGGGSGKVQVQDLTFTKRVDKSTPVLFKMCCSGKHIKSGILSVKKAGGNALEYLKISIEDAIVSAYTTGGAGEADTVTENITLNFARVKMEYTPQKADGTADASIPAGWDIAKNTVFG